MRGSFDRPPSRHCTVPHYLGESEVTDQELLVHEFRIATTRLARRLRQMSPSGLTPSQLTSLVSIRRNAPTTVGELADIEHVTAPTMCRIVNCLEDSGYVVRTRDDEDRRIVHIEPTVTGLDLLESIRHQRNAYLDKQLSRLDDDERSTLASATTLINRILEEDV